MPSSDTSSIRASLSDTSSSRSTSNKSSEFRYSGRGGSGNFRRASQSTEECPQSPLSPSSSSISGRDILPQASSSAAKHRSSGRGGAGNMRVRDTVLSPDVTPQTAAIISRAKASEDEYEREVLRRRMEARKAMPQTMGRGGTGNVSSKFTGQPLDNPRARSLSRTFSRTSSLRSTTSHPPTLFQTITRSDTTSIYTEHSGDIELVPVHVDGQIQYAIRPAISSPNLVAHLDEDTGEPAYRSSGRGGRGNMYVSQDTPRRDRSPSRLKSIWGKVVHAQTQPE